MSHIQCGMCIVVFSHPVCYRQMSRLYSYITCRIVACTYCFCPACISRVTLPHGQYHILKCEGHIHACMHTYIHTYIHTYTHSSIDRPIHPCIHQSLHPFVYLSIHICMTHDYVCLSLPCISYLFCYRHSALYLMEALDCPSLKHQQRTGGGQA